MPHSRFTSDEVRRLGTEWYERTIRHQVERPENVGKLVSIDVETGDYELRDDADLAPVRRLHEKHPGATIWTLRVGYNAAYTLGGTLERTVG